jgi:hypothetical protein
MLRLLIGDLCSCARCVAQDGLDAIIAVRFELEVFLTRRDTA